ncbi:MAG: carbohydrate ABC transporter permease [Propionibacteriaceae bacterium]|jgi:glucose/mannose transport system permease protein|nr:carbohydrate ABC transporter permease [Propionibacteriaceae bacterium]
MSIDTTTVLTGKRTESKSVTKQGFDWGRLARYLILLISLVFVLIPVYVLLVTSFKSVGDADPSRAWAFPLNWSIQSWITAWKGTTAMPSVAAALGRTAMMVIPASIISAFLGSMNGFVLSRWRFPGANIVFTLILFGMFIPYQAVMVPLFKMMASLWTAKLLVPGAPTLILLHVVYGIPITTLIFRNYYQNVPQELIEAARVDGAGMLGTYARVVLPISIPSFVVVLIWQFTSAWNDFLFAVFFGGNPQTQSPVTVTLNHLAHGSMLSDYGASMAGALIASVPTLLIYIVLGRYFVGGLMAGSVKG